MGIVTVASEVINFSDLNKMFYHSTCIVLSSLCISAHTASYLAHNLRWLQWARDTWRINTTQNIRRGDSVKLYVLLRDEGATDFFAQRDVSGSQTIF